jgi:hypothetical protein
MNNECIADFDDLLKKSCDELGIYSIDNSLNYAEMNAVANNFSTFFKDVTLSDPYVVVLKTIANFLQSNRVVLAKNKLYDIFITSYKLLLTNPNKAKESPVRAGSEITYNIFFEICNDLLSSYDHYDEKFIIQIPNLIVDVIAVLFFKRDPYGKKISTFQIRPYYVSKKNSLMNSDFLYATIVEEHSPDAVSSLKGVNAQSHGITDKVAHSQKMHRLDSNSNNDVIHGDEKLVDEDVLHRLSQITRRGDDSIRQSLTALPKKEIKKLYDICNNYNRVIEYGKLDSLKDFKLAIELDLNRSLSDMQVRHSQLSIKKVRNYVENMLDKKFEPHMTHGINHVKHNFEYGFRLVGLISNSKSLIGLNG